MLTWELQVLSSSTVQNVIGKCVRTIHTTSVLIPVERQNSAVWPGDMGIAVPAQFVSTNDLVSTRNALSTMFAAINPNGALPESGPPLSQQGSDTYHAWTLIGTCACFRVLSIRSGRSVSLRG